MTITKQKQPLLGKRIWYMLLFALLCIIDQQSSSAIGEVQMISTNCIGFLVAGIIFSTFSLKDFKKIPYLLWTIVCIVGGYFAIGYGAEHWYYQGQWITAVINVGIYGYIVIRLFYQVFCREKPMLTDKVWFGVWIVMIVWAAFSRNKAIWPLWYLVMFGSFYLAHFGKEEWKALIQGMINGILLGFCLLQGTAFLYRPYDHLRYKGIYIGETHNGLFYLLVYCACMSKWLKASSRIGKMFWFFLSSSMISFILLTMGRAPMVAAAAVTLAGFVAASRTDKHAVLQFIKRGICIVLCISISFPLVYSSVRYLPAILQKPIWFEGEYSEKRVFPWDPKDTDKYIRFEDALSGSFGRLLWFLEDGGKQIQNTVSKCTNMLTLRVHAAGQVEFDKGQDSSVPMMPGLASNESIAIRQQIYQFYASHLNLTGHTDREFRCWITEEYYIEHAHNIFLQYAYQFGIPAGVLLILLIAAAFKGSITKSLKGTGVYEEQVRLLFLTAILVFAMFEITWRTGQMSNIIFFLLLLNRNEEKVETDERVEGY